ncbi:hypothetical protein GUJ93_ZPchr0006g40660 [Zizania palustris]|uniref:Uncharacterized protein n=1 Tax=Zizania palustris TaxID=103762 RepID=A0A8J5W258_ZIZPA|nr:hypothetical protein GUJ93_ZPchr0006g40660 [Zizania palustris]
MSSSAQPSAFGPTGVKCLVDAFATSNPAGTSLVVTEVPSIVVTVYATTVGSGATVTTVAIATNQPEATAGMIIIDVDEPR